MSGSAHRKLVDRILVGYFQSNKTLHASPRKHTLEGSLFLHIPRRFHNADAWMLLSMGVPADGQAMAVWMAGTENFSPKFKLDAKA